MYAMTIKVNAQTPFKSAEYNEHFASSETKITAHMNIIGFDYNTMVKFACTSDDGKELYYVVKTEDEMSSLGLLIELNYKVIRPLKELSR